ncbi:hypothetical protein ACH5RR_016250 [Cinchona calisaya]|uniref:Cytochrome P450 n=1 Tax=Cinchona calisaya TaxID=153742 RepID=A0ABD2ZVG6_9GENT
MAITEYPQILCAIICLLFIYYRNWRGRKGKTSLPFNWPVIGMMPDLFQQVHRVQDFLADILQESGGTFEFKGPWFANMNMLFTSDPANINYILSKNFSNFPKGPDFEKIFDILGEGIFNAESESWLNQRKAIMPLVNHQEFQKFVGITSWNKLENGLIPVLEHSAKLDMEVDLQQLFTKFTFDCTCIVVLGHDPASLGIDLAENPLEKAFIDAEEAIFYRHVVPEICWKIQRWLQVGTEKKLTKAHDSLHRFLTNQISDKSEKLKGINQTVSSQDEGLDLLTSYMKAVRGLKQENRASDIFSQKVWQDTLLNLVFAGKDTIAAGLTWFFWLLATNPIEENIVRQEILSNLHVKEGRWQFSNIEEVKNLVYLHAAICESLRLFPPVALQHKAPVMVDTLPSGHHMKPNTKTVLSFYAMGRMETIWGRDCLEFRPGRWISEKGGIRHEPSFKFTAFNAGPRSCLGKEISFIQMKIVAAALLCQFQFQVLQGHPIIPSESVILHMKHGLKVKVSRTSVRQPI